MKYTQPKGKGKYKLYILKYLQTEREREREKINSYLFNTSEASNILQEQAFVLQVGATI